MPIECLISFDNNSQGVYYAGQELSGVVDLTVDTTKRIKGKQTLSVFCYCCYFCCCFLFSLPFSSILYFSFLQFYFLPPYERGDTERKYVYICSCICWT